MAQGSKAWIWIVAGLIVLLGLCCVGTGVVGWFAYEQQREDEERAYEAMDELRRMEETQALEGDDWTIPPPSLGAAGTPSADRSPRHVVATVTRAEGASGVAVGDRCEFDVQVLDNSNPPGYWCRALVECAGLRLYGTETPSPNGFFPCAITETPRGVAGEDLATSVDGGDGLFQIDTAAGRFTVLDDAMSLRGVPFRVEAAITSVQ